MTKQSFIAIALALCCMPLAGCNASPEPLEPQAQIALGPQPCEVYREYSDYADGNVAWRVTNPNNRGVDQRRYLPNPIRTLNIDDLQDAVRSEVVVDRWGGHTGTNGKRISFNGGRWVLLPEIQNTPEEIAPQKYMYQDNPVSEVNIKLLKEGENTFEGTCDIDGYNGWGQWGMYAINLRVYYEAEKKPHAKAAIVSPAAGSEFGENPTIEIQTESDDIQRIDILAWCEDLDYDGDGVFTEWKEDWFQPARGEAAAITHHVGTITEKPYCLQWDTTWLPDQEPGSVKLIARVQDKQGVWSVTEPIEGLTFKREKGSVRLYKAHEVPPKFGTRVGKEFSCKIAIPEKDDLEKASEARLHLRTWNGTNEEHGDFNFNEAVIKGTALNHHFAQTFHEIPLESISNGDNVLSFLSKTVHHHLEILWPGPSLLVRYE